MYENFGWKWTLIAFLSIGAGLAWYFNGLPKGLDLEGGVEIIYTLEREGRNVDQGTTDTVVQILRDRIDNLGIKELSIARLGNQQVVIQVPQATETEVQKIRLQIEKAGKLEFKLISTGLSDIETRQATESVVEQKRRGEWNETAVYDLAVWDPDAEHRTEGKVLLDNATPNGKPLFVDGGLLEDAYRSMDSDGRPAVGFTWNNEGKKRFLELTEKNVGRQLAVVLDGEIRSAPVIRSAIGKRGVIEGGPKGWDEKELNALIITLKGGALPAKPKFAYQKQVGAQLGRNAVQVGFTAMVGALLVVMAFMGWYYGAAGLVADVAMGMNILLILGVMALFEGTLTLPGIAGILLTAGMSVDANILINERVREELARGTALKQAVVAGYGRAFWTIFDSNLTTVLTALVLMWAGTGPIKGFGLTLTIGIVSSMFTSLFVTQVLMGWLVSQGMVTQLRFAEWFKNPSFDFVGRWGRMITLSLVLIGTGWLVFLARGEDKFGIDFTGGTQLHMRLRHAMPKDALRERMESHFRGLGLSPSQYSLDIQQVGDSEGGESSREWLIRTRLVKSAREGARQVSALPSLPPLLGVAYGQDTPPVPAGGEAPVASPAPVGSPGLTADTAPTATPTTPAAPTGGPELAGPAPEAPSQSGGQDFFEAEIRKAFDKDLVEPYPLAAKVEKVADGAVVTVTANVVGLPPQGFSVGAVPDPTAEMLQKALPRILLKLASEQGSRLQEQEKKRVLERLAGSETAPGITVEAVSGVDAGEGVKTFAVKAKVTDVQGDITLAQECIEDALAKAVSDPQAQFMPAFSFPNIDEIGAAVAHNLKQKAFVATFFSLVFICLYVWLRFDFWAGVSAIVALAHDVFALAGFLAILDLVLSKMGSAFDVKFNLVTISAFLTLVGYSINDTIVILDRIREEKSLAKSKTYTAEIVNLALNRTLSRSILTSGTVFLTVLVLFFASFAGLGSIQGLATALVFGTIAGSYSSIFISAPILIAEKRKVWLTLGSVSAFLVGTLVLSYLVV